MTEFKSIFFLVVCSCFLSKFVNPDNNFIYEYEVENFKRQIEDMDGNFIMFYAPWCKHCTVFHPIWNELAELINTKDSRYAIAQVDCTIHGNLCNENDITGYPTLLYFYKNTFQPIEYKGTRDLPSLTTFLSEVFDFTIKDSQTGKQIDKVEVHNGMAYLNENNFEKYVSKGQHFILFYAPWCKASQLFAPSWARLAQDYARNDSINIGKINCMDHATTCNNFNVKEYPHSVWIVNGKVMGGIYGVKTLEELQQYVLKLARPENYEPDKYLNKKRLIPVARISEDTFDLYVKKDFVFVNYFVPWCGHCMQFIQTWLQFGKKYENDSRIIIADVDCAHSESLCVQERAKSYPYLKLYINNEVVFEAIHPQSLDELVQIVEVHLGLFNTKEPILAKDEL